MALAEAAVSNHQPTNTHTMAPKRAQVRTTTRASRAFQVASSGMLQPMTEYRNDKTASPFGASPAWHAVSLLVGRRSGRSRPRRSFQVRTPVWPRLWFPVHAENAGKTYGNAACMSGFALGWCNRFRASARRPTSATHPSPLTVRVGSARATP
jgi:hypothetical protein